MKNKLKIGDEVMWRGGFGSELARIAKVIGIEVNCRGKYGDHVNEVDWTHVNSRSVLIDLENGHWAYGTQIRQLK